MNKILYTGGHWFIEPMRRGFLRLCQASAVKCGEAHEIDRRTLRRLIDAMKRDDALFSACLREAQARGHRIV